MELKEATPTVIVALLLISYSLLRWKNKTATNKTRTPPQPSGSWPIIGHLHLLRGLPHIALGKLADKYGPIFMMKIGVHQVLVVSTAEIAKECLSGTNDKVFLHRPQTIFVERMAYNGAMLGFNQYDQYWREIRKIITFELLSSHRVEMLKDVRISEVRSAMKSLSAGKSETTELKQWFSDISMNTIVRLVSGKSLKEFYTEEEYNECAKAIRDFSELAGVFVPADALPFLRWFDIGGYEKRMKRAAKQLDNMAQRWLEEHNTRRSCKDFMDVMLGIFETGHEKPSKFDTETIIKATCIVLILAAGDTTAVCLTWVVSLLLNNKDVLKKAQAELDAVVGKERKVEESDLNHLVYLQAVLKESMRLYPPAPLAIPHEAITDCTVSGYDILAGTQLYVNLSKIHKDPQTWEDPLDFHPERFLTSCKDYDVRGQNFEFMPFGSGRRICPGINFVIPTLQFTLANLLHGFNISTPSDETIDMTESFGLTNLKVTPLEVILTHRLHPNLYNDNTMVVSLVC